MKSKTIKSKVTKFQHQKHYVFYDFFPIDIHYIICNMINSFWEGNFSWVWVDTLKVHTNEVTHLLYAHFYAFFKNNLNTLEIYIVVDWF